MRLGTELVCLGALVAMTTVPALADANRGWRPGSDPFGNPDSQRVAHYVSPGLLTNDKVTITFGTSGHFPISFYDIMGNPDETFSDFDRLLNEYPEEMNAFTQDCLDMLGPFALEEEMGFCLIEQIYADATLGFSFLIDVSDMGYENPALGISGIGVKDQVSGTFVPLMEIRTGMACSGPEEASLCVSCFYDFRSLAAQEPGAVCGDPDMGYSLMALDARMPYFALIYHMAANQAEFGQWELAVRLLMANGTTQDLTYVSDDLLGALFGPR